VTADEPPAVGNRLAEAALRGSHVGHGRPGACREGRRNLGLERRHGSRDNRELGLPDRSLERLRGLVDSATLGRDGERLGIRVPTDHTRGARALGGEADGGADQPRADESEPLGRHVRAEGRARA
jgi:hypothetical protein